MPNILFLGEKARMCVFDPSAHCASLLAKPTCSIKLQPLQEERKVPKT